MTDITPPDTWQPQGMLFILSGPSGVGKDTVLRRAVPRLGGIRTSISVTTRPPRPNERDGIDYFFITRDRFRQMLADQELLEHAEVHGHCYGTPRPWVLEQLATGTDVVLEIDVQGAVQIKAQFPQAILVFLAPPNWRELARRLRGRQTEDDETIHRRLENARQELARTSQYNYLIINDVLEDAVTRFVAIVTAERCRPSRQHIGALLREDT